MVFTGSLQEPFKAQLCRSSGLQHGVQGCSKIAAPDGVTVNQLPSTLVDAPMTAWLVGFLCGLPGFLLPWAIYRLRGLEHGEGRQV